MGSLKLKTNLLGLLFLIIPLLGYKYWIESKEFIVAGQSQAQIMMANALASLVSSRDELLTQTTAELAPIMALPSNQPKKIDGTTDEWEQNLLFQSYQQENLLEPVDKYTPEDLSFRLATAETPHYLYLYLQVLDDTLIYRDRDYLRVDANDHIRIEYKDFEGNTQRYILASYQKGVMSAYLTDENWRHAVKGNSDAQIFAAITPAELGYSVEVRFPKHYLGNKKQMSLSVVDVDEPTRADRMIIGTYPKTEPENLNAILLRSTQLETLLSQVNQDYGRVWVLDKQGHVKGEAGKLFLNGSPSFSLNDASKQKAFLSAMTGESKVERTFKPAFGTYSLLTSAPIKDPHGRLIGAILIEQAEEQILSSQKEKVTNLMISLVVVAVCIYALLFLFSRRLVSRIGAFQNSLTQSIDADGRLKNKALTTDKNKDELGELSRVTSGLIQKLYSYTSYLERMPRVLRHELHNPLHVIHSSLFNLEETEPSLSDNKYLKSAHRGLNRLDEMVESFTQASSLDEALAKEEYEHFDLISLLKGYCMHRKANDKNVQLLLHTELDTCPFYGNDYRIEQMLDKLVDNAISFSPQNRTVVITLSKREELELVVTNEGPLLDEALGERIFDPMVSHRDNLSHELHLGVGLFIARKIVQAHQGQITLQNRVDQLGVNVVIHLKI